MQLQTDRQAVVLTADFTQSFPLLGTVFSESHDTAITGIEYRSDVSLVRTRCFDSSHWGASLLTNVIGLGKIIKRWSHQNTLIVNVYRSEKLASSYIFRTDYEPGPLILKMQLCNCCDVIYFTENYVVFHTFCMSNRPLNMNSAHVQTRSLCGIILIS